MILVTGCAGFIGFHLCNRLLNNNYEVYGIDNLNNYYDPNIKKKRLNKLYKFKKFYFKKDDICNTKIISTIKPNIIIHLASMAGVRNSIKNPKLYVHNNINGFIHILEESVKNNIKHIIYASSSSVYGLNTKIPFSEDDPINTCNSPYACSKYAMEIFAKTYNQLYGINCIGLRFFTVYGPEGRPDMAPYKFLKAIMEGKKFLKFGDGTSSRDYTYIDDIINGIYLVIKNKDKLKCEIYNLGNSEPVTLNNFISICENITGNKALYEQIENQEGDVSITYADITKSNKDLNYFPKIKLEEGMKLLYKSLI